MRFLPAWKTQNHAAVYTGVVAYDADAQAYFDAIVTNGGAEPDGTRKSIINTLVTDLKGYSIWTKIAGLQLTAAHDSVAARVCLKSPTTVASAINSPTFTTDRGYAGDGASAYIDTGHTAASLDRTNAHVWAFCDLVSTASISPFVAWGTNIGDLRLDSDTIGGNRARIGTGTSSSPTTLPTADGFVCGRRTGTTQTINIETNVEGSVTVTDSSSGATNAIVLLRNSSTGGAYADSNCRISAWGFGEFLTDSETNNLRTAIRAYMTGVGVL